VAEGFEVRLLALEIEVRLYKHYGAPALSGDNLRAALGYDSLAAMRNAISRDTFPVSLFSIKHRRQKFALVKDIADWLAAEYFASKPADNSTLEEDTS
jgi:hypothetical protein